MTERSARPSLQTIADIAGVSRATVSLALRNHRSIPEKTRERIRKIAQEVGYRPNPMVSSLMAHLKSLRPAPDAGPIAFLTCFPERNGWRQYSTFVRYHAGAVIRAQQLGYRIEEFWLKEPGMTRKKMEKILHHRGIEGILVAPLPSSRGHLSLRLDSFAVALLGDTVVRPAFHRASAHTEDGLRLAMREMHHLGYRRIGLALHLSQDKRTDYSWISSYAGLQQFQTDKERIPIFFLEELNANQFAAWLKEWQPDAVLSGNSQILSKLAKAGVSVPRDLGVAVLDRSPDDAGVAGIDQRPEVVGFAAVDLIVSQINHNERGIPSDCKLVQTKCAWVPGDTLQKVRPTF